MEAASAGGAAGGGSGLPRKRIQPSEPTVLESSFSPTRKVLKLSYTLRSSQANPDGIGVSRGIGYV